MTKAVPLLASLCRSQRRWRWLMAGRDQLASMLLVSLVLPQSASITLILEIEGGCALVLCHSVIYIV